MEKKVMLINALHEEESRVAIIQNGRLQELDIESAQKVQNKNNIYKGTITKVEASLQAAFVEYGSGRQGFLPLNEIHSDYRKKNEASQGDQRRVNIQDVVDRKQSVLVQVVKEERGNKGAALTTHISLAGRYLVLNPNDPRGGISRKLNEKDRRAMKQILVKLQVPDNMGLIIRTAGKDQTLEALERDFAFLRGLWDEILAKEESSPAPSLIYLDGDIASRAIRDHFTTDTSEIWVDNHELYQRTKQFVHAVLPGKEKRVKLYRGKKPLFRHHGIEDQCEEIHERQIRLPSGGSIVIDTTEALTAIDVNSARSTGEKHIDDTALATNLEAAAEIVRQLRIRDIGGLIVIDFIDMASRKHSQQVEEQLRIFCKPDKARIQLTRISRFGLLEMSRQRLHLSVRESTTGVCPRCQGRGRVRTTESMALQMLTRMEAHASAGNKPVLTVQVPAETGEYLMNNKRSHVARIESLYGIQINLQIRQDLVIPHYRIERQWLDGNQQRVEVLEDTGKNKKPAKAGRRLKQGDPIMAIPPSVEIQDKPKRSGVGSFLEKLWRALSGEKDAKPEPSTPLEKPRDEPRPRRRQGNRPNRARRPRPDRRSQTNREKAPEQAKTSTDPGNKDKQSAGGTQAKQQPRRRRPRQQNRNRRPRPTTGEKQTTEPGKTKKAESAGTSEVKPRQTGNRKPAQAPAPAKPGPVTASDAKPKQAAASNEKTKQTMDS
ncbi:MAG: ribonuclease E/G [Mariprofundaceae bacterium]